MKVLVLIASEGWGGGEKAAVWLASALVAAGHEALVVGRGGGLLARECTERGLRFEPRCPGDGLELLGFARLLALVRRERPAVIHAHLNRAALWGGLCARVLGIPCVATAHGMTRASYYRLADRVIAVSSAVATHLKSQAPRLAPVVIPNALEPLSPDPARVAGLRRELAPMPTDRLLLVAGKLHPNKGQRLAIQAVSLVQRCRLALAGTGEDQRFLTAQAHAAKMQGRVVFLGHRTDVPELMAAADAVLVPSQEEAFSLAAAEALLVGTPVIASRTGGLPEVVADDGVLVDSREPADWAAEIAGVLADLPAARARASAGRDRLLSRCAPDQVLARTLDIYAALAGPHVGPA